MTVIKHHPIVRGIALALVYGIGVPFMKTLELTGQQLRFMQFVQEKNVLPEKLSAYYGDYTPTEKDIFVCTYPKSGTNWMMQIAYQAIHDGHGDFEYIHDVIPWVDGEDVIPCVSLDDDSTYAPDNGLRVIKTHLPMEYIPYNEQAKYICIIRDPKDTFVSAYHFFKDVSFGPLMPSVETYLDNYLSDYALFGSLATHLDSYWQLHNKPNALVLTFGEMKADLSGTIQRVTSFLDIELDEDAFARVYEKSSFKYMKSVDHKFYPGAVSPFAPGKGNMIRKGKRGGASEMLSIDQQKRIDDYLRADLKRIGSDLPYDDLFVTI